MKREFNLELLVNKKAVLNCKTKEEEQEFLTYLDSKNIRWVTGSKIFNPTSYKYDRYKKETCFKINKNNELSFDEIYWFKNYTILSLDDIVVKKKLNNFKDYGFEADFEGEILKKVGDYYLGYVCRDSCTIIDSTKWDLKGNNVDMEEHHLTPIKKEWYENPDNFPCIVMYEEKSLKLMRSYSEASKHRKEHCLLTSDGGVYHSLSKCRPATQEEILSLLVKE